MVRYFVCILLFILAGISAQAQKKDSLFVYDGGDGWFVNHKIKPEETIFSIARNYHIPPAMLAGANDMNLQQKLTQGGRLDIPLGAYNLKTETGMYTDEMRPIYHRLRAGESLKRIAKNSNINQRRLLDWNNMTPDDVYEGVVLKVGWILYDATGTSLPPIKDNNTATPEKPVTLPVVTKPASAPTVYKPNKQDTIIRIIRSPVADTTDSTAVEKSEAEVLYEIQTERGVTTEKGPAAFFKSNNVNASFYYAFHNEAPKGTIIKVRNTGNGRTVFVKVLGSIPSTGLYHNCIIGISSRAKTVLGVRDEKAWCELSYGK